MFQLYYTNILVFRDIIGEEMLREDQSKKIGRPGLTVVVYYQEYFILFQFLLKLSSICQKSKGNF